MLSTPLHSAPVMEVPPDDELRLDTPEAVARAAQRLRAAWDTGDPADPELRRRTALGLAALRGAFREHPRAFDSPSVAALRAIADALASPPPRPLRALPAADRPTPDQVLSSVFGYHEFRPGQREIIDAVLAGRDCI